MWVIEISIEIFDFARFLSVSFGAAHKAMAAKPKEIATLNTKKNAEVVKESWAEMVGRKKFTTSLSWGT